MTVNAKALVEVMVRRNQLLRRRLKAVRATHSWATTDWEIAQQKNMVSLIEDEIEYTATLIELIAP